MKCIILIGLIVCSAPHVSTYDSNPTQESCIARLCSNEYKPVCGKQKIDTCWEEKLFNNSCLLDSANDCGKAHYVPCVENVCSN